jgi:hypothetical protein
MLDRDVILQQAIDNCYEEMYQKAQPSANYKELIEKIKSGELKDSSEDPLYKKYYLSQEEFEYIRNKYKEAYNIKSVWKNNIELLESYLTEGGTKDKYIPSRMDEDGYIHPGYRSYEKVKPLVNQIEELIGNKELAESITKLIINNITDCKEYYRFDREENSFDWQVALGCAPTSNKEEVIKYWKSQGKDITIEDKNPLTFWERDYYGDEFEEVMIEEYGKNWKKKLDKKYKEQQQKTKELKEAKWKVYQKELEDNPIRKFKVGDLIRSKDDTVAREIIEIQSKGYKIVGGFMPFEQENNWYHCYEQFKNCL